MSTHLTRLLPTCALIALSPALSPTQVQAVEHDGPQTTAWPLLVHEYQDDGSERTMAMFYLYHQVTDAQGETRSFGVGPYLHNRDLTAVMPFWWRFGPEGAKSTWFLPLWMQGPGYAGAPLALSGTWQRDGGGTARWVTPFFHANRRANGTLEDLHALNYLQGQDWWCLAPLAWQNGAPGRKHTYVLPPVYFDGPDWWAAPPLLSGGWKDRDGSRSTWVTPLFHHRREANGDSAFHVATFYKDNEGWLMFPFAWNYGDSAAALPFWVQGPRGWGIPGILTAHWQTRTGGTQTWVTPLVHVSADAHGNIENWHAFPWFQGKDWGTLFPLVWYRTGNDGTRFEVLPAWFHGPDYDVVPLALSAWWKRDDGGSSTWVTPLYHHDRNAQGRITNWHALTAFSTDQSRGFLPLFYQHDTAQGSHLTVLPPLYFQGPDYKLAPIPFVGQWQNHAGGRSTWVTPLFHHRTDAAGATTDWHLGPYVSIGDNQFCLPYYAFGPANDRRRGVLPLYYQGKDYCVVAPFYFQGKSDWIAPPLLSGKWTDDQGHETTLWTPFFHHTTAQGKTLHAHLLNYVQTPEVETAFPIYWAWGKADERKTLVAPFYFQSRASDGSVSRVVPPALFQYREAKTLDDSFLGQCVPFRYQTADNGSELNLLWRMYHHRQQPGRSEQTFGELLWSHERRPDAPLQWSVLGGLFGRFCNYESGTSRIYALYGLIQGGRSHFTPKSTNPNTSPHTVAAVLPHQSASAPTTK